MKRVFYSGLLALTIAFGVTSCDKNDVGEVNGPLTSVVKGLTSKVSFGENNLGIAVKGNEASKNAGDFTHIYSSAPQSIAIADGDGVIVFRGSYGANAIALGITADSGFAVPIILENGSYRAETMNEGGEGIGYLPYSSTADFVLNSNTGIIELQALLAKGFLIVNVGDATGGQRVTGATVTKRAEGDSGVAGDAISLLEDDRDAFGDYYAYLSSGHYDIKVTYNLNGEEVIINGDQRVAAGLAYTINLDLTADIVSTSETTTSTESSDEAARGDQNSDNDVLDTLSRLVSSTITTTAGEAGEAVIVPGAWMVVVDTNHRDVSSVVTGTEAGLGEAGRDINGDSDIFDSLERDITTRFISIDGDENDGAIILESAWRVDGDYSSAGFGGDGVAPGDGSQDPADTLSAWSAWSPLTADASEAMVVQTRTRTIVINGNEDATPPVGDLSETQTVPNPDSVVDVADEFIYSAFSGTGTAPDATIVLGTPGTVLGVAGSEVEFVTATTTTPRESVVAAYSYDQTRTVSIQVNVRQDDPALDLADADSLTQTVSVDEDRSPHADLVETEQVANPAFQEPVDATDPSGTVNITGLSSVGAALTTISVVAPDGGSASVSDLAITFEGAGQYTVSFSGNPLAADFSITFTVSGDATGSTFTLPASSTTDVAFGNN